MDGGTPPLSPPRHPLRLLPLPRKPLPCSQCRPYVPGSGLLSFECVC